MHKTVNLRTVAQAAESLGIGRRAVVELIHRKELAAQKLPGRTGAYLIEPEEIERYRAENPGVAERAAS